MIQDTIVNAVDKARDAAKEGTSVASETLQNAAQSTRTGFLDTVKTVTSTIAMVRGLGIADMLGFVGLQRKQSSAFGNLASFGAGVAVGAGLGILFAPAAGTETQRKIGSFVKDFVSNEKKEVLTAVDDAKHKVDDLSHKVTEKVADLKHQVKDKVETAKDKLETAKDEHVNGTYNNGKQRDQGLDV